MTDAFTGLRASVEPVAPDARFAEALRARLARALALPRGVTMTALTDQPVTDDEAATPTPAAVPYLAVANARAAIDWYADVFGARLLGEPIVMPGGRIGHAELRIGRGVLYLADEHPEIGVVAPRPDAAAVSLMLPVGDADAVRERALARGATGERPPYDAYGSRNAWIVDPFGHRWGLHSPLRATAAGPAVGHVAYASANVPDPERAIRFYSDVFGWRFAGTHTSNTRMSLGVYGTPGQPTLFCCLTVADLDAAVQRVRSAGGTAEEPQLQAWGRVADCVDDQGMRFALFEGRAVARAEDLELAYVTFEVRDSARFRAFFAHVLGWQFAPGHVADGWQVTNTVPPMGVSGGHDTATALPMWWVADIHAAVAAVRAAGGSATVPERQPYGVTSDCVDNQGMRFHLGML